MSRISGRPRSLAPVKYRVLFVCIGNAVRSQMAEAFARKYGSDVMVASSAGMAPAGALASGTVKVMGERGIDISRQYPKSIYEAPGGPFDVIVNISGMELPRQFRPRVVKEWTVGDPIAGPEQGYVEAADKIEALVMQLVLELRGMATGGV
ncbi:MAG: hypothetical protein U0Q16_26645 [Bryobacteraceae bacterium]